MIYIVEDDSAIRELEQYALQSNGYEAVGFESSEPFWQAVHTTPPELVILDVMLPGEDGFSILKKLRAAPSLRRLPIIMITAKSSELDTVRGLDCGADDYITKPFGIMEFLSRVRRPSAGRARGTAQRLQFPGDPAGQCPPQRHRQRRTGGADLQRIQPAPSAAGKHQPCRHPRDHFAGGVGH